MSPARRAELAAPTEHVEQSLLIAWAALAVGRYPELALLHAIPNGGARHPAVAARMRAEGVKPGVPDLCLPVARSCPTAPAGGYHGLYVELKRVRGGQVQPDQRRWHDALRAEGYHVVVARGWDAAREAIVAYLTLTPRS